MPSVLMEIERELLRRAQIELRKAEKELERLQTPKKKPLDYSDRLVVRFNLRYEPRPTMICEFGPVKNIDEAEALAKKHGYKGVLVEWV